MNKKLFTQIKNEWRSNLWLVTELLLVSVVLWYIVDYMYVQMYLANLHTSFLCNLIYPTFSRILLYSC